MKYIILLGDGMADYPIDSLGGMTPLEAARTPYMDEIARKGTVGLIDTIPRGFPPGSDVANLSVLGYNPGEYYTGRGPLEAASMGVRLAPEDEAYRCNLVTLRMADHPVMDDYSAGHISTGEARAIVADLDRELGSGAFKFYSGVSYRHLLVWKRGAPSVKTVPPHDIVGEQIDRYLPSGNGAQEIKRLINLAREILSVHPVNISRIGRGEKPANSIWPWGQGKAPRFTPLTVKYGLKGSIISAVDLLNGIGIYAGLEVIRVRGATGYIDTDYAGKAQSALESLKDKDFVFVHVEAPDEMGHAGNIEGKIKAVEDFDSKVVGTVLRNVGGLGDYRLMVLSDHPTPISRRTHVPDPSPFAVLSSSREENLAVDAPFGEAAAKRTGLLISPGYRLMEHFLGDWRGFIAARCR
ncbi:MAG: cofactor-independent phosphoglycerate mutase [Syntrophales bacterium]